jgi:hypothetical protein
MTRLDSTSFRSLYSGNFGRSYYIKLSERPIDKRSKNIIVNKVFIILILILVSKSALIATFYGLRYRSRNFIQKKLPKYTELVLHIPIHSLFPSFLIIPCRTRREIAHTWIIHEYV